MELHGLAHIVGRDGIIHSFYIFEISTVVADYSAQYRVHHVYMFRSKKLSPGDVFDTICVWYLCIGYPEGFFTIAGLQRSETLTRRVWGEQSLP